MKLVQDVHYRRSIRLRDYDYSQPGAYFVTICTRGQECLFGNVLDGEMRLSAVGRMVQTVWDELPAHYANVDIDLFQIMPNHIHGIIILTDVGAGPCACPNNKNVHDGQLLAHDGQPRGVAPTGLSLPDVVHRFKTMTTKRYTDSVKQNGRMPFSEKLWQRNYYEHIIRDEAELDLVRQYIAENPLKWSVDRENPTATETRSDEPWQV